ncbi:MAG: hypothetical protein EPN82_12545 [Bacteroidetes bacterium]|nr:MAG: hypothetical protein EPN82_12545 [Bacteroidota bacterium]
MIISQDTKEVVKFLQDLTGGNLRKPNDLELFLEIGASYGLGELMNDFIFNAASIWNISQSLKKTNQNEEIINKLKSELKDIMHKFSKQINEFLSKTDDDAIEIIKNKYLLQTIGSHLNIIDLAHDLSELKIVQNTIKSKK